jgi:hypothetical protein
MFSLSHGAAMFVGGRMKGSLTIAEVLWELEALHGRTAAEISLETYDEARTAIERSKSGMSYLVRDVIAALPASEELLDDLGVDVRVTPVGLRNAGKELAQRERLVLRQVEYEAAGGGARWFDDPALSQLLNGTIMVWYLRDLDSTAAYPIIWSDLWVPTAAQATRMQWDYTQVVEQIERGGHLSNEGEFLGTCPRHGGGFDIDAPSTSDEGSVTDDHPTLDVAERRAWELKRGAVEEILASSLRRLVGADQLAVADVFPAIGLPPVADQQSIENRSQRLIDAFTDDDL